MTDSGKEQEGTPHVLEDRKEQDGTLQAQEGGAARDATLHALEESERRYREIFDTNPAVKIVIDPDTGALVDVNRAACLFYGYDKPTLLSMRIHDINTAPRDVIDRNLERAREGKRLHFIFKHRLASGEVRDVEIYTGPLTVGGRRLLHSIIIDVTERQRLQQQLLQAQRMDALGHMAGGVAHDFNNLLTVILTCVDLTRRQLATDHPALSPLGEIEAAALRGAEVTQQLLALARKRVVEPEVVALSDLVERTTSLLRRLIGEHIELEVESDPALWNVRVDPVQFEQVLVNLAVNARDAMPGGGKLSIATANADFGARDATPAGGTPSIRAASVDIDPAGQGELEPGRWVRMSVTDTGTGMSSKVLSRIFEPFFTTKQPGEGTGLGLSTVFGIVRQAGGHVSVRSTVRVGSTFDVFLPAVDATLSSRPEPPPLAPLPAGAEVVLVVEDDAQIRRLLCEALGDAGYRVLSAADGEQALSVAAQHGAPIHLLVSDVVMPRMGGVELASRLRERLGTIPVLFVSGHPSDLADDPGSLSARFLAKPFTSDRLVRAVQEVLEASRAPGPTPPAT